jgi:hypothetical protein
MHYYVTCFVLFLVSGYSLPLHVGSGSGCTHRVRRGFTISYESLKNIELCFGHSGMMSHSPSSSVHGVTWPPTTALCVHLSTEHSTGVSLCIARHQWSSQLTQPQLMAAPNFRFLYFITTRKHRRAGGPKRDRIISPNP